MSLLCLCYDMYVVSLGADIGDGLSIAGFAKPLDGESYMERQWGWPLEAEHGTIWLSARKQEPQAYKWTWPTTWRSSAIDFFPVKPLTSSQSWLTHELQCGKDPKKENPAKMGTKFQDYKVYVWSHWVYDNLLHNNRRLKHKLPFFFFKYIKLSPVSKYWSPLW